MAKKRPAIPKATKDQVLSEFNHRCAICGGDGPQIHHLDENPENNRIENLLPLCPNCHLRDQHNPTAPVDRLKLSLFRRFKDPSILHAKFEPLWRRSRYLVDGDAMNRSRNLVETTFELILFVAALQMGEFYSSRLHRLLAPQGSIRVTTDQTPSDVLRKWQTEDETDCIQQWSRNRNEAVSLIVEMLRYQDWN